MLNVSGLNEFYFLCNFHNMRYKYDRVRSIIRQQLNREPESGGDMNAEEKSNLRVYLQQAIDNLNNTVESLREELRQSREQKEEQLRGQADLRSALNVLSQSLLSAEAAQKTAESVIERQARQISDLRDQLKRNNKAQFGSKSQKKKAGNDEPPTHGESKDQFDGTSGSVDEKNESGKDMQPSDKQIKPRTDRQKMADILRKGSTYRTMDADTTVTHRSDKTRLPAGAQILKTITRYGYEHKVSVIESHTRAKFKYASDAGDRDADYVLGCIGELYALEDIYRKTGLDAEAVRRARNSTRTLEIIGRLRSKMEVLLAGNHPVRGELMEKAVRYLETYWKQIFRYTQDGRYSIDNNIAERYIRPLAGERKNSLFFGSHKMARASAVFHTVISTCRICGLSALDYLRTFFRKIVSGTTAYSSLLPQTIGLSINKC